MSTKVNDELQRRLVSGDVNGEALNPEEQFDEGVTVEKLDGQRVFFDKDFLRVMQVRNRGRD